MSPEAAHASTIPVAKRRAMWPWVSIVLALAAVPSWFAYDFWSRNDWSTDADASAVEVMIDKSPSAVGALLIDSHVDSSFSYDYQVEVSTKLLSDDQLYVNTSEWREDGYVVELWISFAPSGMTTARALVHWQEDSGSTSGFVQNLHGTLRLTQNTPPPASGSAGSDPPFIVEYELTGDQRGRPVTIRRKVIL